MSLIHYKFKAAKDYNSLTFEGLSISLFELKRDILIDNKLKGADFDIIISNAQTNEDYHDDGQLIPKNTSVYVRRVPAKPGGTNAQQYLTAGAPATAGAQSSKRTANPRGGVNPLPVPEAAPPTELGLSIPLSLDGVLPGESEEDKLKALFDQSSMQWDQQHQPSGGQQNHKNFQGNNYRNAPPQGKPLSANYICHRCGIRGHYVQNCPTIGDKSLNQPKVRRTTGIPRSFLKNIDAIPEGKGAMITNDGALVVAQTNDAAWKKFQLNQRGSGFSAEELRDSVTIPPGLDCTICNKLLSGAVLVPCCKKLFCLDCITEELLNKPPESQFTCPHCHTRDIVPDSLIADQAVRNQVEERLRLWAMEREGDLLGEPGLLDGPLDTTDLIPVKGEVEPQQVTPLADSGEPQDFNGRPGRKGDFGFPDSNLDGDQYDLGLDPQYPDTPEVPPFEMPPLRWTPDGGISGHINIPPMEMLGNGEEHSDCDQYSNRGHSRDRRDYRDSQGDNYDRGRRSRHNNGRKPSYSPSSDRRHYHRDNSRVNSRRRDRSQETDRGSHHSKHDTSRLRNTDRPSYNERRGRSRSGDEKTSSPRGRHSRRSRSRSNDSQLSSPPSRRSHRSRSRESRAASPKVRRDRSHSREDRTGSGSRRQRQSRSRDRESWRHQEEGKRDTRHRKSHASPGRHSVTSDKRHRSRSPETRRSKASDHDRVSSPGRSKVTDTSRRHRSDDHRGNSDRSSRDSDPVDDSRSHRHRDDKETSRRSPGTTRSHRDDARNDRSVAIKHTSSQRSSRDNEEDRPDRRTRSSQRSPSKPSRARASPSPARSKIHPDDDEHVSPSDGRASISVRLGKRNESATPASDILSRIGPTRDRSLTSRIGSRVDSHPSSTDPTSSKRRRHRTKSDRHTSPDLPPPPIRIAHISKRS